MKTLAQLKEEIQNLQELSGKTLVRYQELASNEKERAGNNTVHHVQKHDLIKTKTDSDAKRDSAFHMRVATSSAKTYHKRAKGLDLAKKAIARKP